MDYSITFKGWAVSHRIKQKEIADLLGVTTQSVSNKMNGRSPFTLNDIKILTAHYGVSAEIFLNEC